MINDEHKVYYTITEVAAKYGFKASKLRHWETIFSMLKPEMRNGDRIYTKDDLEVLDEIVYLVEVKKQKLEVANDIMVKERSQRQKIKKTMLQLAEIKEHFMNMKELTTKPVRNE